ncbi:MAG: NAD(P)H-hydrate dehydratase [Acidimicrobiia bacterium]
MVTPVEMAAVDAAAPEPVEVLVARAGAAVARAAVALMGGAYGRRVVVVAGKGNNGADGRVAADRLRRRGARVAVLEAAAAPERLGPADLVVDAAYGTGFRGTYRAPDPVGVPVLAVDVPSGVSGLTGEADQGAVRAVRTVTFAALKPGLLLEPGRGRAGAVEVADIGLDVGVVDAGLVEASDVRSWVPPVAADAHKWRAAVLVVAGSPGMTGAAHLAAAAAQRAGAGMVRVASPGAPEGSRPLEAVAVAVPRHGWSGVVLEAAERCGSVVIGPGLGTAEEDLAEVRAVLAGARVPVVVDGDGLRALGGDPGAVLAGRAAPTVLTPHDGEHARLAGGPPGPDRMAAARSLAAAAGAVVLLKGPTTVVADPAGQVRFVTAGDRRLATAGTGDVLSGVVGALLARGTAPLEAAAAGAWLHGRAGHHGPGHGLVASDLVAGLTEARAEVDR